MVVDHLRFEMTDFHFTFIVSKRIDLNAFLRMEDSLELLRLFLASIHQNYLVSLELLQDDLNAVSLAQTLVVKRSVSADDLDFLGLSSLGDSYSDISLISA